MNQASIEQISSKKLQGIKPALYLVIDGVNLIPHTAKQRMLVSSDEIDINRLEQRKELSRDEINIESLYTALVYLQGTALNLSGHQRVFIRTRERKVIALDPRLAIPPTFDAFSFMMWRFCRENLVKGEGGERLLYYVKSDIGESLPPGIPRICAVTSPDKKIAKLNEVIASDGVCLFVNLDTTQESQDELMQSTVCVSNDDLSCTAVLSRLVLAAEAAHGIW